MQFTEVKTKGKNMTITIQVEIIKENTVSIHDENP